MIELGLDQPATLGRATLALDDQIVPLDRDSDTAAGKPRGNSRETIAFLDAQLGEAAHDRASASAGGCDGEDWVLVNHSGRPLGGDIGAAFQGSGAGPDVGDRLASLLALVQQGNVRPHLI
jgi:hypothetical protein